MQQPPSIHVKRIFSAISASLGWVAVIAQLIILFKTQPFSAAEILARFFSYFTILTNITVAFYFSVSAVHENPNRFFSTPAAATGITVYIIIVGAVYNFMLRALWHPAGLQVPVDELLHTVIPILSVVYWLVFVPKSSLQWKDCLGWLIYPLVYGTFIAVRGAFSGFYPYPFINVPVLGYQRTFTNAAVLLLLFLCLSLFMIAAGKLMSGNRSVPE